MIIKKGKILDFDLSSDEKREIIQIYALKICKLWDYYNETIQEIIAKYKNNEISIYECSKRMRLTYEQTKLMCAKLLIEQFYNTGEEDIFDRAMKLDENVELKPVSIIDMKELEKSEDDDKRYDRDILLYYQGLFLYLKNNNAKEDTRNSNLKAIIRDESEVEKINKKILRGRRILEIDEVTLGKKYYEGLCKRTHFMKI